MNNKGLIEYKENFFTKIRNFFFKLFKKSKAIQEPPQIQNNINIQDNKSNFVETIVVKKDEKEEKLIQLQRDYKDGNILEDDIPHNEKQKLVELYKKQNQEMKNKIEQEQKEIRKLLDCLKVS